MPESDKITEFVFRVLLLGLHDAGTWRVEAGDSVHIWTCLMSERVKGHDIHVMSHST